MNLHDFIQSDIARRLGWTVFHAMWQLTAAMVLMMMGLLALRRRRPQWQYAMSCLTLTGGVLAMFVTFWLVDPGRALPFQKEYRPRSGQTESPMTDAGAGSNGYTVGSKPVASGPGERGKAAGDKVIVKSNAGRRVSAADVLAGWAAVAWCLGAAGMAIWQAGGWVAAFRLGRLAGGRPSGDLQQLLDDLCVRLGVTRPVRLAVAAMESVPAVIGWLRPVVLWPASLATGLPSEQVRALLAHELAHIRRLDGLVAIGQALAETVGFFHPATWWISRQVRIHREHCCDDVAAEAIGSRLQLARSLQSLELQRLSPAPSAAAAASGGSTVGRIRRLLTGRSAPTVRSVGWVGLVLATALLVALIGWGCRSEPEPEPEAAASPPVAEIPSTWAPAGEAETWVEVTVLLPAAAPLEMERQVTSPVEQAVKRVEGVSEIRSISGQGMSRLHLRLTHEQDLPEEQLLARIRQAIPADDLPAAAEGPHVVQAAPPGPPIASDRVLDSGPSPEIVVDPEQLLALGVTAAEVRQALSEGQKADRFEQTVIKTLPDGSEVRLSDIAELRIVESIRSVRRRQVLGVQTRSYDLVGMGLVAPPDFKPPGGLSDPHGTGQGPAEAKGDQPGPQVDALIHRIRQIEPDSWADGRTGIEWRRGRLIVRQEPAVLSQIEKLLAEMRAGRILVDVEARFIRLPADATLPTLPGQPSEGVQMLTAQQSKALVERLSAVEGIKLLAAPPMTLIDGQSGYIRIGQVASVALANGEDPVVVKVNLGTMARVRPLVSQDGGSIRLELHPHVASQPDPKDQPQILLIHEIEKAVSLRNGAAVWLQLPANWYRIAAVWEDGHQGATAGYRSVLHPADGMHEPTEKLYLLLQARVAKKQPASTG
ncbi:MAG: efflux RND transporter permease subunit [Phycisphaerae bacterium]